MIRLWDLRPKAFFETSYGCFQKQHLTMDARFFMYDNALGVKVRCNRVFGAGCKVVMEDEYFWVREDDLVKPVLVDSYTTLKKQQHIDAKLA